MDTLAIYQNHRTLLLVVVLPLIAIVAVFLRRDRRLDNVPGPKLNPLIGLGFKLPPNATTLFREWADEYGEIFKVRLGWYNWVVINSPEAVRELLEKQAVATSSKAPSPLGHDVVTGGMRMPTMEYGPRWKAQRSVVRQITSVPMTNTFVPSQEFEMKQLLHDLATDNENMKSFYMHMRRFAFSIILTNTFGTRVKHIDHPDVHNAMRSQAILRKTLPPYFIVDELPPLQKLPEWLQPGRKEAEECAKEVLKIKMNLWRRLERQHEAGKAPACYGREILESKDHWYKQGLTDVDLAWVAGGLVEAGFETSAATLNSLILHLAAYPRVQAAAQKELMRVVGPDRCPMFEDIQNLPYVRACVKEMLRMNPILQPGIRHYTDQDVVYKNHVIPKGTVLLANTAFLHYDPSRFENPYEFMPERYLNHDKYSSEYAAMGDPYKRDHFTFNIGRRTCPGARVAENSLDIALAGILWAFEIKPPKDDDKIDLSPSAYPNPGFTTPGPFSVRFIPWDDKRLSIVKEQWETARKEGYELRGVPVDVDGMVQY
ncbi:O-methylsterigmatocystin oxidoreductase [Lecanosticta acicola]|uniref:O-methylsterigmatocystin oxidoreductase n=1 Tax=Lecanosticta acicola TaxID=111012 RepID=A0AAI9E8I4_9PEZI|nr:O-methylsterigmatocystin oxidoreductase [Lecanosticta acicola]